VAQIVPAKILDTGALQSLLPGPVLADLESHGAIKIAGAMYNLKTNVADFFACEIREQASELWP
jgi:hypothetical protein